ncbi:MAG TPA: hypothetical protein VMI72_12580 [Roseiarcus sp.]|nr:hypothetical protein [Roseiarcus sp.]
MRQGVTRLSLALRPASTKRVHLSYEFDEIADFVASLAHVPPLER